MEIYKIYFLFFCIHLAHGKAKIDTDIQRVKDLLDPDTHKPFNLQDDLSNKRENIFDANRKIPFEFEDDHKPEETEVVSISNDDLKEAIYKHNFNRNLLHFTGFIFRNTLVLALEMYGWHLTSRFVAAVSTMIYGPYIYLLIPVIKRIGKVFLK